MLLFMHLGSLLLLALVFVIVWAIRAINTRLACKRASCHQKRGHLPWDIFGISKIIEIVRAVLDGSILFYMETLWNLYGDTYTVNVMGKKITFTSNAANIRQILQNQFKDYDAAKGIRISMFEHVAPGTIAATDGREWKDNRSKWRHYVAHLDQVLNLDFVEGEFKSLIRRVTEGAPVDMQPLFLDFTTDIIHAMTLGESTNCINPEKQSLESKNYVASLIRSNSTTAMRGLLGPVARFIFQGGYKKDCTAVKEYLGHRIQNRLAAEEQGEGQAPRQETFLDRLLRFTHDPVTLNHNVTSMIMASEPISGPLSHTIWLLSRDSAVYEKLRKSVLELVGYQRPTYEQFTKFTYLKNVINECKHSFHRFFHSLYILRNLRLQYSQHYDYCHQSLSHYELQIQIPVFLVTVNGIDSKLW
jgi:hypothetical protein